MSDMLTFKDLMNVYGPVEAMRTIEMLEELVRAQENREVLRTAPEARLEEALEKLIVLDFSGSAEVA